jgi:hypothetical protein
MLGVGEVRVASDNMAEFRIRNKQILLQHIVPIFDQYRLLTSKYFNYYLFKQALLISIDSSISNKRQQEMLTDLKNKKRPENYISPV